MSSVQGSFSAGHLCCGEQGYASHICEVLQAECLRAVLGTGSAGGEHVRVSVTITAKLIIVYGFGMLMQSGRGLYLP